MKNFQRKNILVVGQVGSGKSNFIDNLIISIIKENNPKDLKLVLFDPKKTQFTQYNSGIPQLLLEIVHDLEKAKDTLEWILSESLRRTEKNEKLPAIIIIIEELADFMMADREFFEDHVERITALSEITGIYFVVATSRPSSEYVLTEKIRNCFSNRICFRFADENVSLLVLGQTGAESLLNPGNCLVKNSLKVEIENLQMPFVSDEIIFKEISSIKEKYNIKRK